MHLASPILLRTTGQTNLVEVVRIQNAVGDVVVDEVAATVPPHGDGVSGHGDVAEVPPDPDGVAADVDAADNLGADDADSKQGQEEEEGECRLHRH